MLPDARLGYLTLGELNAARDNVVLCPTWFTGVPADTAAVMTGPGRALDPERWFIVIPGHFGGGRLVVAVATRRRRSSGAASRA